MLRMEVLAIGVCCSATFPRGSERCSGEDHGTSSVGRYGVGGYPREGDASLAVRSMRRRVPFREEREGPVGQLRLLPRNVSLEDSQLEIVYCIEFDDSFISLDLPIGTDYRIGDSSGSPLWLGSSPCKAANALMAEAFALLEVLKSVTSPIAYLLMDQI
ncbi:hypothetical protein B296_00049431 [Ensete ventricosum]|uniref:Uncharacterized protein n=1 Tax=Ensete ventricosum TaxID=4639 RepID=A0A426YQQ6_ENSVE|nr:hypothetical protein B296_00049431 [Ensete ventricosum]